MHEIGAYSVMRLLDAWRVKCGGVGDWFSGWIVCCLCSAIDWDLGQAAGVESGSIIGSDCVDGQWYTYRPWYLRRAIRLDSHSWHNNWYCYTSNSFSLPRPWLDEVSCSLFPTPAVEKTSAAHQTMELSLIRPQLRQASCSGTRTRTRNAALHGHLPPTLTESIAQARGLASKCAVCATGEYVDTIF